MLFTRHGGDIVRYVTTWCRRIVVIVRTRAGKRPEPEPVLRRLGTSKSHFSPELGARSWQPGQPRLNQRDPQQFNNHQLYEHSRVPGRWLLTIDEQEWSARSTIYINFNGSYTFLFGRNRGERGWLNFCCCQPGVRSRVLARHLCRLYNCTENHTEEELR